MNKLYYIIPILLHITTCVSSACFLSYERMNEIPLGNQYNKYNGINISLIPEKCGLGYALFDFFIDNGTHADVLKNKTRFDGYIDKLTIDNYLCISWFNITKLSKNPFCDMFNLYINDQYIKPISMFSCIISYVSYINNECGQDVYNISPYDIILTKESYVTMVTFKLDTFGTYRNIKV